MWVETVQGSILTVVELNAPGLTERIGKLYFDIWIGQCQGKKRLLNLALLY